MNTFSNTITNVTHVNNYEVKNSGYKRRIKVTDQAFITATSFVIFEVFSSSYNAD